MNINKPFSHDAIVKLLKNYGGDEVKQALDLISKKGATLTIDGSVVTVKNTGKSVLIDLSISNPIKPLSEHNGSLNIEYDKKIEVLAQKIIKERNTLIDRLDQQKKELEYLERRLSTSESQINLYTDIDEESEEST